MGLLQGAIEAAGISSVSISVRPEVTINMRVPRAVYVRFPTGNPVGEPGKPNQQRTILRGALAALAAIQEPGTLLEMPYRWRRMGDEEAGPTPPTRQGLQYSALPPQGKGEQDAGPSPDLHAVAQAHVAEIQGAYGALMGAVDRYRAWLAAELAAEQAKPAPEHEKVQALSPQLKYLTELAETLEGPGHDGLVRVSDRAVRIRHWQEGIFI